MPSLLDLLQQLFGPVRGEWAAQELEIETQHQLARDALSSANKAAYQGNQELAAMFMREHTTRMDFANSLQARLDAQKKANSDKGGV